MKKQLLILTILLLTFKFGNSQTNVYHPFPDTNAVWRVNWYSGGSVCHDVDHVADAYQYTIGGDTIMGIYNYKKIFKTGQSLCFAYYHNFYGGLRQDTINKKVYFKSPSYPDTLIYDFSKHVGDTLHLTDFFWGQEHGYNATISSIDSVLVGSVYRKRFNLNGYNNPAIIEGIGATSGLLEGSNMITFFEDNFFLICFSHDADVYHPNIYLSCFLSTDISQLPILDNRVKIFPNPFDHFTTIEFKNPNNEKCILTVYNSIGKQVRQIKNISGQTTTLNRDTLPNGLYFIRLTQENKILAEDKLLIID